MLASGHVILSGGLQARRWSYNIKRRPTVMQVQLCKGHLKLHPFLYITHKWE